MQGTQYYEIHRKTLAISRSTHERDPASHAATSESNLGGAMPLRALLQSMFCYDMDSISWHKGRKIKD